MTSFTAFDIPNVVALAQHLGKPIAFFDLETSALVGAKNFGITEMGVWRVMPDGRQGSYVRLMNPENWIPPEVEQITGITNDMVKNEAPFSAHAAVAAGILSQCLPVGFNIRSFDIPGLHSQLVRYNVPVPPHGPILDLRDAWIHIKQSKKGKLVEVAAEYGCAFDGAHRAMADTIGCVHVLEAMIVKHGMEKMLTFVRNSDLPQESLANTSSNSWSGNRWNNADRDAEKLKARDAILKSIQALGYWDQAHAMTLCDVSKPAPYSFAMADLLTERLVTPEQAAHPEAQAWLTEHWDTVAPAGETRLKPILEKAQSIGAAAHVDYIQLRVTMLLRVPVAPTADASPSESPESAPTVSAPRPRF